MVQSFHKRNSHMNRRKRCFLRLFLFSWTSSVCLDKPYPWLRDKIIYRWYCYAYWYMVLRHRDGSPRNPREDELSSGISICSRKGLVSIFLLHLSPTCGVASLYLAKSERVIYLVQRSPHPVLSGVGLVFACSPSEYLVFFLHYKFFLW